MPHDHLTKKITAAVVDKYGSLSEPNFGFVQREWRTTERRQIIDSLKKEQDVDVAEHTDINDDVAINFTLNGRLTLWLSLVGPFAFLRRLTNEVGGDLIVSLDDCRDEFERRTLSTVKENGIVVLGRETLLASLPLAVLNRPPTETKVYHALFADDDEDASL